MAILNGVQGLEVNVRVNGVALQEYQGPDEAEADTATQTMRYIEATSGATFDLQLLFKPNFEPPKYDVGVDISVDGTVLHRPLIMTYDLRGDSFKRYGHERLSEGCKKRSDWIYSLRKYEFADLDINDTSAASKKPDTETIQNLGEIRIVFHHKKALNENMNGSLSFNLGQIGSLSEKSLKGRALSHHVKLGESMPLRPVPLWTTEYVDDPNTPLAVFVFRYRSMSALKAACIIPRTPTPVPLEERPIDELTEDELRVLVRRQRERKTQVKQERGIKRERAEESTSTLGDDNDEVQALDERPAKFRKVIDTVDLTAGDDDEEEEEGDDD